ncbi:hypothetical protein HA402_002079 [Bradysia odoriphaga]|nr:hypothetical protein HA402_002079 [Bradysia odoriphaga]
MLSSKVFGILYGLPRQMNGCRNIFRNYLTLTRPQKVLYPMCNISYVPITGICNNLVLYQNKKPTNIQLKTGKDLIKNAIEIKRGILLEKKDDFVKDMRIRKTIVKEKVREKIEEMEEIVERENVFTIPNLLCVGRGLLAPYLGYVIVQQDYALGMGLLIFAGITDILDGYIARNWPSQASKMGSFLDPMADKLLVGSLVISLTYTNLFPVWLCGMVLFRDVFLIGAGFVIRYISLPPPKTFSRYFDVTHATAQLEPTFISKVNTAVQLITIASSLGAPIWDYADHPALHGLWYFTGATTFAAAVSYIVSKDTYKIIKESRKMKGKTDEK